MHAQWPYFLLGLLLLSTAIFAGASLRGGSRLQRRLFLLFLGLSFVPSIAILFINWRLSQDNLDYLDSPGLHSAVESSLNLARTALERERVDVRHTALLISEALDHSLDGNGNPPNGDTGILPELPAGWSCRFKTAGAAPLLWGENAGDLFSRIDDVGDNDFAEPARFDLGDRSYLVTAVNQLSGRSSTAASEPPRLLLAARLEGQLAHDLEAITEGNLRFRQVRLYYGSLLKGDTLLMLAALGIVLLIASLLLSRYLARRIGAPVQQLAQGAAIVAGGDLDHRVRVAALDEINDLVVAFNRMTSDLKISEQDRKRAERIAAWQGIARRLAHEIKNPLTPIGLSMHRIRRNVDDATVIDCVDTVLEETENLRRLADEFSMYARLPAPQKETSELTSLIESVVDLYAERTHLTIQYENWIPNLTLDIDPGQIRQVFANLIKNAVESMGSRGSLILKMVEGPERFAIEVKDTGAGFSGNPEDLFEPYFTTKEAGTGLGLAIARKIMIDHGGSLTLVPSSESGAIFSVAFPRPDR